MCEWQLPPGAEQSELCRAVAVRVRMLRQAMLLRSSIQPAGRLASRLFTDIRRLFDAHLPLVVYIEEHDSPSTISLQEVIAAGLDPIEQDPEKLLPHIEDLPDISFIGREVWDKECNLRQLKTQPLHRKLVAFFRDFTAHKCVVRLQSSSLINEMIGTGTKRDPRPSQIGRLVIDILRSILCSNVTSETLLQCRSEGVRLLPECDINRRIFMHSLTPLQALAFVESNSMMALLKAGVQFYFAIQHFYNPALARALECVYDLPTYLERTCSELYFHSLPILHVTTKRERRSKVAAKARIAGAVAANKVEFKVSVPKKKKSSRSGSRSKSGGRRPPPFRAIVSRLWPLLAKTETVSRTSQHHENQYQKAKARLDELGQTRRMTDRAAHMRKVPRPIALYNHLNIIDTPNPFLSDQDRGILRELRRHVPSGGQAPELPPLTVYDAKARLKGLSEDAKLILKDACHEFARQEALRVVHLPHRPADSPPCFIPACLSCGVVGLYPIGSTESADYVPPTKAPPRVVISHGNGKGRILFHCMYCEGREMSVFDVSRSVLYAFLERKMSEPVPVSACPRCHNCFIIDQRFIHGKEALCVQCYKDRMIEQAQVKTCFMGHSIEFQGGKEAVSFEALDDADDNQRRKYHACEWHIHPNILTLGPNATRSSHELCVLSLSDTRSPLDITNK